jgi:hypothetical protein
MKTKLLVILSIMLVVCSTVTALPLVHVQAKAVRITVEGFGIPGDDPLPGTYRMWWPDGREHVRSWTRDFTAFTWSEDYPFPGPPDPRFTGINRETYVGNQYRDSDGILIGTLKSEVVLLPTEYDNGDGTYSGWWEGTGHGKTWHGDVEIPPFGYMNFAFKTVLQGKGVFKGMITYLTISVENFVTSSNGFEVQGYVLDTTQ